MNNEPQFQTISISATDYLVAALKVFTENIKVYHRNMYGSEFLAAHEFTGTIYDYLDEMTDKVIEMFMPLDYTEIGLDVACMLYDVFSPQSVVVDDALLKTLDHIEELNSIIFDVKESDIPAFVVSKLEEYEYQLSVFIYKLNQHFC